MKNVNHFQIAKVQPAVAYKSVAYEKMHVVKLGYNILFTRYNFEKINLIDNPG